jgi:hypothetical protein
MTGTAYAGGHTYSRGSGPAMAAEPSQGNILPCLHRLRHSLGFQVMEEGYEMAKSVRGASRQEY